MGIVINKTVIMFILIAIGILCVKVGILNEERNKGLSLILLNVIVPAMVIDCFQMEFSQKLVNGLMWSVALAVIMLGIAIILTQFLMREKTTYEIGVSRFMAIYGNVGFMGIPLLYALFGQEGVFFLSAYIALVNLLGCTHGAQLMIKEKRGLKLSEIFSPPVVAVFIGMILFFCKVMFPEAIAVPIHMLSDMTTPVAMIVCGAAMASFRLKDLKKWKDILKVTVFQMLLMPMIIILVSRFLPIDETVRTVAVIAAACPSMTMGIVFSIKYGHDAVYASEILTVTTAFFIVTLPLMIFLMGLI